MDKNSIKSIFHQYCVSIIEKSRFFKPATKTERYFFLKKHKKTEENVRKDKKQGSKKKV